MKIDTKSYTATLDYDELNSLFIHYASIKLLPKLPGIYIFRGEKFIWYVGASQDVYERCKVHSRKGGVITQITGDFTVSYLHCSRRNAIADIEVSLIQFLNPKLNKKTSRNVTGAHYQGVIHET